MSVDIGKLLWNNARFQSFSQYPEQFEYVNFKLFLQICQDSFGTTHERL